MKAVTELFTGGLVTARVGAMLASGELQRADDCFYREKDPSIWRAPGRTALTSTAIGTTIRGMKHLSFDGNYAEQMLFHGRKTAGSPTWVSGPEPFTAPSSHLYAAPFTAISGLVPDEVGHSGLVVGTVTSTTFEAQIVVASCTISGTAVTSSAGFTNLVKGMVVSGTGVTAGTRVLLVIDPSNLILDTSATNGTVTLTFTTYPFLASAVGANMIGTSVGTNVAISAVSNQDGTTGHYRTATLTNAPSGGNGVYKAAFNYGTVGDMGGAGTEILDAIQFNARRYFVWDSSKPPLALDWRDRNNNLASVLNARPIGLRPVVLAPTLTLQTGQATGWNTVKGAGQYWILITEIFSPNSDIAAALLDQSQKAQIVESAYLGINTSATAITGSQGGQGLPIPISIITPATDNILVTFPAPVNNGTDGYIATHWGIYIYGPSVDLPSLALLRRCATVPITTYASGQTYVLTDATLSQTKSPTAYTTVSGYTNQWTRPDLMIGAPDSTAGTTHNNTGIPSTVNGANQLNTFGFSTSGSYSGVTPIGMSITFRAQAAGALPTAPLWLRLKATASGRTSNDMHRRVDGSTAPITLGGPMDTLGAAWTNTDTSTIALEVGIDKEPSPAIIQFFWILLTIHYTTVNVDFNGPAYRVVTFRDQVGLTVSDPARLLPPTCTTGDFFQGCLVLNDLSQINTLRYSLPDDPEAFPKPYRLTFNTRKRDKITYIRSFNGILFVGMENTIKRVMYLPRETDTDMTSGLAHEDIATDHGIPGPFCATTFDMPGKGVFMAYASSAGLFISNGIWTLPLNMDLDWENTVKLSALSTAVLRNYGQQKMLALYYCPAGATHDRNTRVLYFSYQIDKLKGEYQLPAIGPSVVSARAACEAYLNGRSYLFTANEADGLAYVEDNGITIPTGYQVTLTATSSTQGDGKAASATDVKIVPLVRSRKFYSAGMNRDIYGDKVYLLFAPYGTTSAISSCVLMAGSTTVTGTFPTDITGWRVKGTGIDPGTIVKIYGGSSLTLSRAANTSGTVTLTFDNGTISIGLRGSGLGEAVKGLSTDYVSTLAGDLVSVVNSNLRRGFELQLEKVAVTFDGNGDTATWADLQTNMRLHSMTYMTSETGLPDTNRNTT